MKLTIEHFPFREKFGEEKAFEMLKNAGFDGDMNLEIIHSFDNLPLELYLPLLNYTAKVGRLLIDKFEEYKKRR